MFLNKFYISLLVLLFVQLSYGQKSLSKYNIKHPDYKKALEFYHENPDSALVYVNKYIADSANISKYEQAKACLLAGVLEKNLGNTDEAYLYYRSSDSLFAAIDNLTGMASVQNNLARLYQQSGKLDMALQALLRSVYLFETDKDTLNMAESYTNLADLYIELEDYQKAKKYLNKAQFIYHQTNNKVGEAFILTNNGIICEAQEKLDSAFTFYIEARRLLNRTERPKLYADACIKIGNTALKQSQVKLAENYFKEAEIIYKSIDYPLGVAKCEYGIGNYNFQINRFKTAISYYKNALKIAKRIEASALIRDILYQLYLSYKNQKNANNALQFYEQHIAVRDSLFGIETGNNIAVIQAKNDLLIRQNQIDKLRDSSRIQKLQNEKVILQSKKRKISIIALLVSIIVIIFVLILIFNRYREKNRLNSELSQALSEREVLLKELHHRVKNNLQIISSLLNLQKKYKGNKSIDEVLELSRNRIATMVSVHEKLYQSKNFKNIDIGIYSNELVQNISNSFNSAHKNISINVKADSIKLSVNKLISFGLILNELLTNAYKHAFIDKKNGIIDINITCRDKQIIMDFKDDGVGFQTDSDPLKSDSLGIKLINGLTEQIGGIFKIMPTNTGTHIKLSFEKND